MRGNQGVVIAKNSYSLTGVTWSFMFIMVFCFAGCAAGSCLSYGHSCWGAHGKRSGPNNLRPLSIREVNEDNNSNMESPSLSDHWMLSRLITKRHQIPNSGKYRVRLYDILKGREIPRDWDNNDSMASKEENIIRDHTEKLLKSKESEEESKESESYSRELTENFEDESAEIILLPRHGENKEKSGQFRFIKITTNTDDNLK